MDRASILSSILLSLNARIAVVQVFAPPVGERASRRCLVTAFSGCSNSPTLQSLLYAPHHGYPGFCVLRFFTTGRKTAGSRAARHGGGA